MAEKEIRETVDDMVRNEVISEIISKYIFYFR
jgi:hypothetical protein